MKQDIEAAVVIVLSPSDQGGDRQLSIGPGAVALGHGQFESDVQRVVDFGGEVIAAGMSGSEEVGLGLGEELDGVTEAAEVAVPQKEDGGAAVGAGGGVRAW